MSGFILGTSKLGEGLLGPIGEGSANLGTIVAQATATRTTFATAQSSLSGINATANASVTNYATADSALGNLSSQATAQVLVNAVANAPLGALVATANSEVENVVTATASLGGIDASASVEVTHFAQAQASLGSLLAVANTEPEAPTVFGGGGVSYVQPYFPPSPELEKIEPIVQTQFGITVSSKLGGLMAQATSDITFSTVDDESELLLLI